MVKWLFVLFFVFPALAKANCTLEVKIEGAIGSGSADYVTRVVKKAQEEKCSSILAIINTPGGSLDSTRIIVEKILNSDIPFLCVVAPKGAHAGSAGAIILQACHVNGALTATNIGAATPVLGTGQELGKDMRNKMINDTVSWLEGITKLRQRNLDFSKKIVTEAKAVSSEEAFKTKAIDILATDIKSFLEQASGRVYKDSKNQDQKVIVSDILVHSPDSRLKVLQFFSDPQISYLLFMASLALLYFEITHPGTIAPGVIGGIGLIISLINFHMLEVYWGGLALILLGIVFLVLEAFVASFGMLGIGGIICFVLGGVFLFDSSQTGYSLPLMTILPTAIVFGGAMFGVGLLMLKTRNLKVQTGSEEMIGKQGVVAQVNAETVGMAKVFGELWKVESNSPIKPGDKVTVVAVNGLVLKVKKDG